MIQRPKGTLDIYDKDGSIYNFIYNCAQEIMDNYNFEFIKVPTFEDTSLFYRGVGEGTDIVNKETYDFIDKGDRKMTLRPEFTAGVIRSYIENKMFANNMVKKLWYFGSAFRYERPQSGRYREFTQFGVEVLGVRNAFMDAEVISLAYRFLSGLGITNMKVKLNTLGDKESRQNYRDVLYDYLKKDYDSLCDTCKDRLERNPLRILDCKYDNERDYIKSRKFKQIFFQRRGFAACIKKHQTGFIQRGFYSDYGRERCGKIDASVCAFGNGCSDAWNDFVCRHGHIGLQPG